VGVTDDCPDLFVALITSLLDETVDVEPLRRVVHHTANPKGADHLRAFLFAAIPTDLSVCQNSRSELVSEGAFSKRVTFLGPREPTSAYVLLILAVSTNPDQF